MRSTASVPRVALLALLAVLVPSAVQAQTLENPFDAEQQRLADEVRQRGRSARAILPLIQLNGGSGNVRPEITVAHLQRLSVERRLSPAVRMYARALLARAGTRAGDPDATRDELDALGYVRGWRVIGSFDNEGKTGFAREYGPEAARMAPLDPDVTYEGREREARWREYPEVTRGGYISFDAVFRPRENVCGYAETFVESERARALTLWVGGGGATRVWWNGEVVHEDEAYRAPHFDRAVAVVGAHRGLNRVLVKTCVTDGRWGFYLRVADG
ncbi:MAG TPA: hypothetical protein ENK57_02525, partial [Polyangiaceae bacterium]|nr:hypothetical protein [Polyangiaceae bacterium]